MDPAEQTSPRARVTASKDLVGEIIQRMGSSVGMIRCGGVSSIWRAVKKTPFIARRFAERNKPAFLGFMVQFVVPPSLDTRVTKLLYPHPSEGEETAVAMRPHVNTDALSGDKVIASVDGIVLTRGSALGGNPNFYFTSCPSKTPRVYTPVADIIPPIPTDTGEFTKNTFGQFGVIPNAGDSGMSFFVKDAADCFFCCYDGVSWCSNETIFVHVCIYNGVSWIRHSKPFSVPHNKTALFHRNPYSVLAGKKLYMMYSVGYIVCFDLVSTLFSKIPLPSDLNIQARSWFDYSVCYHSEGAIALVHYRHGYLHTWVLNHTRNDATWDIKPSLNLVDMFGPRIPACIWSRVFRRDSHDIASDPFWSIQLRTASPNASFLLMTLTFDRENLYEVDMVKKTVRDMPIEIANALIGHIFPLSEPWPPMA